MSDRTWDQSSATMSISTPPIHLILIPLPVASLLAVLATDVAYWLTRDPLWAQASFWLVATGLVTGPTAGVVGLIDFMNVEDGAPAIARWVHIMGMGMVLLVTLVSFLLRSTAPEAAIVPWGLALAVVTVVLLAVGAWYGGMLAYRRAVLAGRGVGE
jgi:uncharacterized membrane protein